MSDDERVGYKKPPRKNQFRPGESGNPSGKKTGTRSISTELREILNERITFAADGAVKTMTKQRALASSLVSAAIEGDLRATAIVMSHLTRDELSGSNHVSEELEPDQLASVHALRKRKAKLKGQ